MVNMKKVLLICGIPLLTIILFVAANNTSQAPMPAMDGLELDWPEEVMTLIETSCFDCHTKEASNAKAKMALNFTKWEDYKLSKKIGKLNDISQEVKEQKMPPKKYISKYPEKALNEEEIRIIAEWANTAADKLMEE